jgi:DNA-binding response OmpR family regulator
MKQILLIDDDQFIRDVVASKISNENYAVTVAATAEEGLRKAVEVRPDLILLDLELPDKHGFDVLNDLKATVETANVPIIIFSNNDSDETKAKAKELGATDFFVKIAVDPHSLLSEIESVLS